MVLPKLGFKQNLLLVVLLTTFGFSFLVYMSISALGSQADAAERVDLLGGWVIGLSNIKADMAVSSTIEGDDWLERLKRLHERKIEELEVLRLQGMEEAEDLEVTISEWVDGYEQRMNLIARIGSSNDEGQRASVTQALDELVTNSFSFMREDLRTLSDAVYQLIEKRSKETMRLYDEAMTNMRSNLEIRDFLKDFEQYVGPLDEAVRQLASMISQQQLLEQQNDRTLKTLAAQVERSLERVLGGLASARKGAEETSSAARMTILITGALVTGVCMLLLLITWRRSTHSLSATLDSLEKIAAGDLSLKMPVRDGAQDEFDRLGSAVNHLTSALGSILNSVKGSSGQLLHMSSELNDTMKMQVQQSEQVESETTTVAASIEEISYTVAGMAKASEETNQLSVDALTATENGGHVITDALGLLEQLSDLFEERSYRAWLAS